MGVLRRATTTVAVLAAVAASVMSIARPEARAVEAAGGTGTITLRVLDSDGTGSEAILRVWRRDGDQFTRVPGARWERSGTDGGWNRISGLPLGVDLTVSATPETINGSVPADAETFFGRRPSIHTAEWFRVDEPTSNLRLPSMQLERGAVVTGTLRDLAGRAWSGRSGVLVRAWLRTPAGMVPGPTGIAAVGINNAHGAFEIGGLWPNSVVTVGIDPQDSPVTAAAYLGGASDVETARTVLTSLDRTVSVGDLLAPLKASWASGRVVDSEGNAVWRAGVAHYADVWDENWIGRTDRDGRYGVHVMWGAQRKFLARDSGPGGGTAWAGGGTSFESAGTYAAAQGQAELGLDDVVVSRPGVVVRGRVVAQDGPLARAAGVAATWESGTVSADTDPDGYFELSGIPSGSSADVYAREKVTDRTGVIRAVHVGERAVTNVPDVVVTSSGATVVTADLEVRDPAVAVRDARLVALDGSGSIGGWHVSPEGDAVFQVSPGRYGLSVLLTPRRTERDVSDDLRWWWGGTRPAAGSPFVIEVADEEVVDLGALAIDTSWLSGHVRDSAGHGLDGANVSVTSDGASGWVRTVRSDADGAYAVLTQTGAAVQIAVDRKVPAASYPEVRRGTAAAPVVIDGERHTEDFVLTPAWDPSVGAVAGVRDEACMRSSIHRIGTELGLSFVDGVLTTLRRQDTDRDWTDPSKPQVVVAPLQGVTAGTTWGRSADGSLCFLTVSDEVAHQVWLAPRSDGTSDVTINYDRVRTDAGQDGERTSVVAGWSDGFRAVVLPGAGGAGDYDDDGRYPLVGGSRGSDRPGRYRFHHVGLRSGLSLTNIEPPTVAGDPRPGRTLTADPGTWAIDGVPVDDVVFTYSWSRGDGYGSSSGPIRTLSWEDGGQSLTLVVTAWYPGTSFEASASAVVQVEQGTGPDPVVLTNTHGTYRGMPVVLLGETQEVTVHGCAAVEDPTYTVDFLNDEPDLTGPMTPGSTREDGLRDYTFSLQDLPTSGAAKILTNVPLTCEDDAPLITITIYIDPAGVVTDQYGVPLSHSRVTLFRADTEGGDYSKVPDGSELMAPTNQSNPVTAYDGTFRWDVAPGWYQVRAANDDLRCAPSWSVPMEVPPAHVALLLKLNCESVWAPKATTSITGEATVGNTLVASTVLSPPIPEQTVLSTQWYRSGEPIDGATSSTYTLRPEDAYRRVVAAQVVGRTPYEPDDGRGRAVKFASVRGAAEVSVEPADPDPPTSTPTPIPPLIPTAQATPQELATDVTSKATSTTTVKALAARASAGRATVRVRVRTSGGEPTGVVEFRTKGRVVARAVLGRGDRGRAVVRLKRLKRSGAHTLTARYLGSSEIDASRSTRITLRIGSSRVDPRVLRASS